MGPGRRGPVFRRLTEAWMNLAGLDFVAQAHGYARQLRAWEEAEIRAVRGVEAVHAWQERGLSTAVSGGRGD